MKSFVILLAILTTTLGCRPATPSEIAANKPTSSEKVAVSNPAVKIGETYTSLVGRIGEPTKERVSSPRLNRRFCVWDLREQGILSVSVVNDKVDWFDHNKKPSPSFRKTALAGLDKGTP